MCVLIAAFDDHPDYDLVIAANRDEFHARPTSPAGIWDDAPEIIAGRDLEAGGTWLGINRRGRFAAVTNLRGGRPPPGGRSRGLLVADFLARQTQTAPGYAAEANAEAARYAGVNLLAVDEYEAAIWCSDTREVTPLHSGLHGLSNGRPGEDWPKIRRLKQGYLRARQLTGENLLCALLAALHDDDQPEDDALPETGVGLTLERQLAPVFIQGGGYGTRCSTVVLRARAGQTLLVERRYNDRGEIAGESRHAVTRALSA